MPESTFLVLHCQAKLVAAMEEILDTCEEPIDSDFPVFCMDEQPLLLHKEIRKPIAATKKHARCADYPHSRTLR